MDIETIYRRELVDTILAKFADELGEAKPGSCLKVAGLCRADLEALRESVRKRHQAILVVMITDGSFANDFTVTAEKLVELRNAEKEPILALVPSAIQTASEDSYGKATFRELDISDADDMLNKRLQEEIPPERDEFLRTIFDCTGYGERDRLARARNEYLIAVRERQWGMDAIGEELDRVGLIPDKSFTPDMDPGYFKNRILANGRCLEDESGERGIARFGVLPADRVAGLPIKPNTIQKALVKFLNVSAARNRMELVAELRRSEDFDTLEFGKWQIDGISKTRELKIEIAKQGALASKDFVTDEDGDKTLKIKTGKSASVKFRVVASPAPHDFPELRFFRVKLVAVDGGAEVADALYKKVTETKQAHRDLTVKISEGGFQSGTYFLRVYGEDENGAVLNLADDWRDDSETKRKNESEEFAILFEDDEDGGGDDTKVKDGVSERSSRIPAAYRAYMEMRIGQLTADCELEAPDVSPESGWSGSAIDEGRISEYNLVSGVHRYKIQLPTKLRTIERTLLDHRSAFGFVRATMHQNAKHVTFTECVFVPVDDEALTRVLEKRNRVLRLVSASCKGTDGADTGVFETWFDLCRAESVAAIKEYVAEFRDAAESVLASGDARRIAAFCAVDTAEVTIPLGGGREERVRLLAPIHPLRLAWFANLSELYREWEKKTDQDRNRIGEWKEARTIFVGDQRSREGALVPTNNPIVAAEGSSRYLRYAGELAFGWGVWARTGSNGETIGLSDERRRKILVADHFNMPIRDRTDTDVSEEIVCRHVESYLRQHPYVRTLLINVFNPGEGAAFARSLVRLEQCHPELSYEFRLVSEGDPFASGEAFRMLTDPDNAMSEYAESFSAATENALFPKLRFSLNRVEDFVARPGDFAAHISFCVNPFASRCRLVQCDPNLACDALNGLIVTPKLLFSRKDGGFAWTKAVRCRDAASDACSEFAVIGNGLLNDLQRLTATVMAGGRTERLPGTSVEVGSSERTMIGKIHDASDWVVTFDNGIGPEMFDSSNPSGDTPYLLDYVPGGELTGISSFLTTRPGVEAYQILKPSLEKVGLGALLEDPKRMRQTLEDVRAVSGSLLMQALTTDNKAFEVLGMALTKRLLEKKRYLSDAFLIPLDLHKDVFSGRDGESNERADLLVVACDVENRKLVFHSVEIKCRKELRPEQADLLDFKVAGQLDNTEIAFRREFGDSSRIDHAVKNIRLRHLLEFYVLRAERFDGLSPEVKKIYLDFLATLDQGFAYSFSPLEIVFNFAAERQHEKTIVDGITRYEIGKELVDKIVGPDIDLDTIRLEETIRPFRGGRISVPHNEDSAEHSVAVLPDLPAANPVATDKNSQANDIRILLGKTAEGKPVYWEFGSPQLSNRHFLIFGNSGMGKTYAIQAILLELAKRDISSLIVDYTNGFIPTQLDDSTKAKLNPVQHVVMQNKLPINPFRRQSRDIGTGSLIVDRDIDVAMRIASIFAPVYNLGDQQASALRDAIKAGLERLGENMRMESLMQILPGFLTDGIHPRASVQTLIARLRPFIESEPFRQESHFGWRELLHDAALRCQVFQMAGLDSSSIRVLTEFILWDLWAFASAEGTKETPRLVVLDEVQNLDQRFDAPLGKYLTEGRKFGLCVMAATQTLSNLSEDERARLFQAGHKLFFRPSEPEINRYADFVQMSAGYGDRRRWSEMLSRLGRGECLSVGLGRNQTNGSMSNRVERIMISPLSGR